MLTFQFINNRKITFNKMGKGKVCFDKKVIFLNCLESFIKLLRRWRGRHLIKSGHISKCLKEKECRVIYFKSY